MSEHDETLKATAEKSSAVGNAAAMRKALNDSNELLEELARLGEWWYAAQDQIKANNAALAKPPRNCDVGTAKEQTARWWKWCDTHLTYSPVAKDNCAKCPIRDTYPHCEFSWAQMPYDESDPNVGMKRRAEP